jgi:hypothetical protein
MIMLLFVVLAVGNIGTVVGKCTGVEDGLTRSESRSYKNYGTSQYGVERFLQSETPVFQRAWQRNAMWTFLVYMCADNNLEGAVLDDLDEMEFVGSTKRVNIIVLVDWWLEKDGGYIYYITQDDTSGESVSTIVDVWPEPNMGDPKTLTEFIRWASKNYPAQNYALDLWNHGDACWGLCFDVQGSPEEEVLDYLTIPEIDSALSKSHVHFSIIGFDACLMGNLEVAYQIREHTDIYVGSEETIPWEGWPYDRILESLTKKPSMTPEKLAEIMVYEYVQYYVEEFGYGDITMSAIETAPLKWVGYAVAALSSNLRTLLANHQEEVLDLLWTADRSHMEIYINETTPQPGEEPSSWILDYEETGSFMDIYHFSELISDAFSQKNPRVAYAADLVKMALDQCIIAERHEAFSTELVYSPEPPDYPNWEKYVYYPHPNAHGLTVFADCFDVEIDGKSYNPLGQYKNLEFSRRTQWYKFLLELIAE